MMDYDNVDLNAILHPGSVFEHPRDVVSDHLNRRETCHPRLLGFGCHRRRIEPSVTGVTGFILRDD
jgi:hypothetical protein